MFWNKYPYTDFHELNLDWILKIIKELVGTMEDFININTLKYADPISWNITTSYEGNTIVIDSVTGIAYLSKTAVPAGVHITNTEYWLEIFDFSPLMTYKLIGTPQVFGAKADGINDDTDAIQKALDNYQIVLFPSGTYLINDSGINVNSGNKLIMASDAVLKMQPTSNGNYHMIRVTEVEDVTICGGIIDGSRNTHIGNTGEQGHCIKIGGSKNVIVSNVHMIDAWGDGLTCYAYDGTTPENVKVLNCEINNCRRNGLTITSGLNIDIDNIIVHDIAGTAPQMGIIIEPTSGSTVLENININNANIFDIVGACVQFNMYENQNHFNIHVNGGTFTGQAGISITSGRSAVHGSIIIENAAIKSQTCSVEVKSWDPAAGNVLIKNVTALVDFSAGDLWSATPFLFTYLTDIGLTSFGNIKIESCKVNYLNGNTGTGYDAALLNNVNGTYDDIYIINNEFGKIKNYDYFTNIEDNKTIEFRNPYLYQYPGGTGIEYNNLITNYPGAGTTQIKLLPSAALYKNKEIFFQVLESANVNDGIEIVPDGDSVFPSAYPNGLLSRVKGSALSMKYINNQWAITGMYGTWTAL